MVPAEQIFWDFIKFRHKWKFGFYEFYSHGKWHVPRHDYFSKKKKSSMFISMPVIITNAFLLKELKPYESRQK